MIVNNLVLLALLSLVAPTLSQWDGDIICGNRLCYSKYGEVCYLDKCVHYQGSPDDLQSKSTIIMMLAVFIIICLIGWFYHRHNKETESQVISENEEQRANSEVNQ